MTRPTTASARNPHLARRRLRRVPHPHRGDHLAARRARRPGCRPRDARGANVGAQVVADDALPGLVNNVGRRVDLRPSVTAPST